MTWTDGEPGPVCSCGVQTTVQVINGKPALVCARHTVIAINVQAWPLTKERPASWPVASHVVGHRLVGAGAERANA